MDNRSRTAAIRTGSAFPDDIAGKYYVLESHLGSDLLRLNTSWGGSVIDREETAFRFAKTAEKKAITEQYYPFGDSSLRTFTKKRFRYVGKEGRRKIGLGDLFFLNKPACALAKVGSITMARVITLLGLVGLSLLIRWQVNLRNSHLTVTLSMILI